MITINVADSAGEWREEVLTIDHERCMAREHHQQCLGRAQVVHHIVFKSHLSKDAYWIVENGIALSEVCHVMAHGTHNRSLPRDRVHRAVDSVNVVERYKVKGVEE